MSRILYSNDGEVASFPYHFEIRENEDGSCVGEVSAFVWKNLRIQDEQREALQKKLDGIPVQVNSGFFLEKNEIVYRSFKKIDGDFEYRDEEIDIRRHFIEDYLEAERDLTKYVSEFHAESEKTEFLN